MSPTAIPAAELVDLRAAGTARATRFVDPCVISACTRVLAARGETWAAAVLGRDLTRRSTALPHLPWLRDGEEYTLVAADVAEDRARFAEITGPADTEP